MEKVTKLKMADEYDIKPLIVDKEENEHLDS
jgi:hypothetical protein